MLSDNDFYTILNSLSSPVLVVSSLCDDMGKIVDFIVEYVNQPYKTVTHDRIHVGDRLSVFSSLLAPSVDWFSLGVRALAEDKPFSTSYFAPVSQTWFSMTVRKVRDNLCVLTLTDINSMKRREEKLDYLVYHDTLTGLPNRAYFDLVFSNAIADTLKTNTHFGLMLIDIDNMKAVNTILGTGAGDRLLQKGGEILASIKQRTIQSFRLGDDKYLVLVTRINSRNDMTTVSNMVFDAFREAEISISAGIVLCPDDSARTEDLLKYVNLAVTSAKKHGKNNVAFFKPPMYEKFMNQTLLQQRLIKATEEKSFELYFQPQFNIATNELRGFEALLRWYDTTLGWVSPDNFIPVAEETRVIYPLGQWVLETALETLEQWQKQFGFGGIISVNVSPLQLKKQGFISDLFKLLERCCIRPGTLEVEITEGTFIEDMQQTVVLLNQLRKRNVLVSLDDFGTGYSSFRYLQFLPITTLKIDKTFVSHLVSNESIEAEITSSIVNLVSKLHLETIAEGVESMDQLKILKSLKCENIQGYLYGKPMNRTACEAVLSGDISALIRTGDIPIPDIVYKKIKS